MKSHFLKLLSSSQGSVSPKRILTSHTYWLFPITYDTWEMYNMDHRHWAQHQKQHKWVWLCFVISIFVECFRCKVQYEWLINILINKIFKIIINIFLVLSSLHFPEMDAFVVWGRKERKNRKEQRKHILGILQARAI